VLRSHYLFYWVIHLINVSFHLLNLINQTIILLLELLNSILPALELRINLKEYLIIIF